MAKTPLMVSLLLICPSIYSPMYFSAFLTPITGVRNSLESPGSSELNDEEESPEPDVDYLDEYDSEEERKQRRRKRPLPKTRIATTSTANTRSSTRAGDTDKPFLCSGKPWLVSTSSVCPLFFVYQFVIDAIRQQLH